MSIAAKADPATPAGSASPLTKRRPFGDRSFQVLCLAAGLLVLIILALIAISMTQQSTTWFTTAGWSGVFSTNWDPAHNAYGALPFIYGTLITAAIAIVIAFPVSLGIALLLTEVVPGRFARPIVYVIDLLAVVPSVVWGLWGFLVLAPWLQKIYQSIASGLTGVPVLSTFFTSSMAIGQGVPGSTFCWASVTRSRSRAVGWGLSSGQSSCRQVPCSARTFPGSGPPTVPEPP